MTPSEICLDACVFISALDPRESEYTNSSRLMRIVTDKIIALYEPAIVMYEVTSTIHRKVADGALTPELRDSAIDTFFQLPLLFQWHAGLLSRSAQLATELSRRKTYDCNYLAVAMAREIPLVTLDTEIIHNGKRLYRKIYSVKSFLENFADQ